jgi:hypothetical protein
MAISMGSRFDMSGTGDDDELVVFDASWFWCKTGSSAPATAP